MKDIKQLFPWMTRQIDRRSFLNRSSAATFGALAGLAVGVRPGAMTPNVFPCYGLPDCRSYSTAFCNGHNCVSNPPHNYICTFIVVGCPGGGSCWSSNGKQCCDCQCSWCCPGNTVDCICYG